MSTRYNTGNPIESTDVRDMSDNAKNFDDFSISTSSEFTDRLGVNRLTIHGMNSEFDAQILNMGFTRIGTFAPGATMTNPRQTLLWDAASGGDGQEYGWTGALPKIVPPLSTPNTTGGIAIGAWVSRYDAEVRIIAREALSRGYAEDGYNLVAGSFQVGFTLVNANDIALDETSGKAYSGTAGTYPANTPTTGFVDKSGFLAGVDFVDARVYGITESQDCYAKMISALAAHAYVYLPAGKYFSSGTIEHWRVFGLGELSVVDATVPIQPSPQTTNALIKQVERTFGTRGSAVGSFVSINHPSGQENICPVLGSDARGLAQVYPGRDHVGHLVWALGYVPTETSTATTYTATRITASEITPESCSVGMIIDTKHATMCTGVVTSVGVGFADVSGWFTATTSNITPANGVGANLNPINKVFGQNVVVNGDTVANCVGTEYNIFTKPSSTPVKGTFGLDIAFMHGGFGDTGIRIYGDREVAYYSYNTQGSKSNVGFRSYRDKAGLSIAGATRNAIEVTNELGDLLLFRVGTDGKCQAGSAIFCGHGAHQAGTGGLAISTQTFDKDYGATATVVGFNIVGGARFRHQLVMNGSGVTVVGGVDDTGCGVSYSIAGQNTLVVKTTSGTIQFKVFIASM